MRLRSDYVISRCWGFPQMKGCYGFCSMMVQTKLYQQKPFSSTWYLCSFYSFERKSSLLRENTSLPNFSHVYNLAICFTDAYFRTVIIITYFIPNNFLIQSLCSFDYLLPISRGLLLIGSLLDSIAANLNA